MSISIAPPSRNVYPTYISNEAWTRLVFYLMLASEETLLRHVLRGEFNALRLINWVVPAAMPRQLLPTNILPWLTVYQLSRRYLTVGWFEALATQVQVVTGGLIKLAWADQATLARKW